MKRVRMPDIAMKSVVIDEVYAFAGSRLCYACHYL